MMIQAQTPQTLPDRYSEVFGVSELGESDEGLSRPFLVHGVKFGSPSVSVSVSLSDSDADALSLLSTNNSTGPNAFNETTWADAYLNTTTNTNTTSANHPELATLAPVKLMPALSSLPLELDWDDSEDEKVEVNDMVTKLLGSSLTHRLLQNFQSPPSPEQVPQASSSEPASPLNFQAVKKMSKRFSDPHAFNNTALSSASLDSSSSPIIPRRFSTSLSTSPQLATKQSIIPCRSPISKNNLPRGFRRYSHTATCVSSTSDDLLEDHDDRFINIISKRLQELDDADALLEEREAIKKREEEVSSSEGSKRFSFSNIFGSSPTASTNQNNHASMNPHPSPLVTFISRAFGPRRSLQRHNQHRPLSYSSVTSSGSSSQRPFTAPSFPESSLQHPQRASMPHISWSSWSSNTSASNNNTASSSRRSSQSSSITNITTSLPPPHAADSSSTSTAHLRMSPLGTATQATSKETRTRIAQGLKLFEMGATEAAFATFRDAAARAAAAAAKDGSPPNLFAEFVVVACVVHGYAGTAVAGDSSAAVEEGIVRLKELKQAGEVLAARELEVLGVV